MYLKRLEMQGFKSFADKTVLEFMPGITAVIGPNGSGKSNISDAVRWVLGEQSIKSLRGNKLEDVIFSGTHSRKSLGFAEVTLVIDNSDGRLPVEYQEVSITRRAYRSGESLFMINNSSCRLKDILGLFMDTGIGKDGYSIIGQGKIDEILSNKSEDRRHIFEEAAGIVKYRTRKNEAQKKLENTKLNMLRINDIILEIEGQLEPLKQQSSKAKEFLNLRDELKGIELGLFLDNIAKAKEKLDEIVKKEEELKQSTVIEQNKLHELNAKKELAKINLETLFENIELKNENTYESRNKIEKLSSSINVTTGKIQNNNENIERMKQEIEELKEKILKLEEDKNVKLSKKDNLYANKDRFVKELEEKEKELSNLTKTLTDEEERIEKIKETILDNMNKKIDQVSHLKSYKAMYENAIRRNAQVREEISSYISKLDEARLAKINIQKTFKDIEEKRNIQVEKLQHANEVRNESKDKIKGYADKIIALENELRMKQSKYKFAVETQKEKAGYLGSVKAILNECERDGSLGKGVYGAVASLITVPKEYETAIEMCLGASLQNIVTKTEQEAKRLVEYLKKNSIGRASFLPISAVKGRRLESNKIYKEQGFLGIACDLISYDKKYEGVINSLLGRVVIVDNMDNAIAIAKKNSYGFKIVTLAGDIINPSGQLTGGSTPSKTINLLSRTRQIEELKESIEKLEKQIQINKNELNNYEQEVEEVLKNSEQIVKDSQEIEIIYATQKQKVIGIEETIQTSTQKLELLRKEQTELNEQQEKILKNEEEINIQNNELEDKTNKLQQEVDEFALIHKDKQMVIDNLNEDITNLKISVSSFEESEGSIDEMLEMLNAEITTNANSIDKKLNLSEKLNNDNILMEEQIENTKKAIGEEQHNIVSFVEKIEKLKEERENKNDELKQIEQNIEGQLRAIDVLKEQVIKIDVKREKYDLEIEANTSKMWEEYELTPNNIKENEYIKCENITTTNKKVNQIRDKIKALGSINIDAIEEYKQTLSRYEFLTTQMKDLEEANLKLKKVISEMTDIMKKQFNEQFNVINQNFKQVFTELFGGGKANLKLSDDSNVLESGIEIEIEPPGKKLQNMMLLSGGERAFTAIALLFAILKLNPAPFCVLDEIEAALDDINVYRYAEYLKRYIANTQFLLITHRKGTMEVADTVYGATMEENGISKLISMKLK